MLSPEQVASFHANGFVRGSRVLDDETLDELRSELEKVSNGTAAGKPVLMRNLSRDPQRTVLQIINIWEASPAFHKLISHAQVVAEVAQLTGAEELRIWHDQIQYKPADTGGATGWHQDAPAWPTIAPMTQVTAWIALDDVDAGNGAMSMVPGSHRWGDQGALLRTFESFDAIPAEFEGHPVIEQRCPVGRGVVHFHHALTWHGSRANSSGRPRRAIALHYMTQESRFVAAGEHPMKQFIEVADGEKLAGEHFPLVWSRSAMPAAV